MSDLIDKDMAIAAIRKALNGLSMAVMTLPPAQTERKRGKWIKTISENGITSAVRCSECGFEDNRYMLFRYCPHCGADMRGGQNE